MLGKRFSKSLVAFAVVALAIWMTPGLARATKYSAQLVQCAAVTIPSTLSNCGQDPLTRGAATISNDGEVEAVLVGAAASQPYAVVFRAFDGSSSTPIGTLNTNAQGNGTLRVIKVFNSGKVGTTGAGNVVMTRAGFDQFVGGLAVKSSHINAGADFEPGLVPCGNVSIPGAISSCGSDPLTSGKVDIESDDGDLTIQIHGAGAKQTYTAVLHSPGGAESTLGTFGTDKKGNGNLVASNAFAGGSTSSGTVLIKRSSAVQFLTGFSITTSPPVPQVINGASLVRCFDVNEPILPNCGTDPLVNGTLNLSAGGQLHVSLQAAEPSVTYQVVFRPTDTVGGATDMSTGLALTTDQNGNANASATVSFFPKGTIGSGEFVVQRVGFDQFITGFGVK